MEDMGGAAGGGREGVITEGPGAPPEVCRCAPVKGSTGVDVNLQYSTRIIPDCTKHALKSYTCIHEY